RRQPRAERRDGLPAARAHGGPAREGRRARARRVPRSAALEEAAVERHDARLRLGAGGARLSRDLRGPQIHFMSPIWKRWASAAWYGYARMRYSSLPQRSGARSIA